MSWSPPDVAASLLARLGGLPTSLGTSRLICIDGPSGAGKSTLAAALASARPEAVVVRMDDLYAGWSGLTEGVATLRDQVLAPILAGRHGSYRRYDWHAEGFAETVPVAPSPLVIVEGVGAGAVAPSWITLLVWVEAAADVRLARAVARDGEAVRPHLVRWARDESAHFATARTRERADVVLTD